MVYREMTLITRISVNAFLFGLLIHTGAYTSANNAPYYRYINENGVKVISSQIPPRYVKRGYDIITIDGRLIERVAPEPSDEEKAKMLKQQEEQERLNRWDKELLGKYSEVADIEAAKQRKLEQNATTTAIIRRRIEKIDQEINRYQSIAAADERKGKEVSPDTLESIARLKHDRTLEYREIEQNEKERKMIEESYDKDIARFKIIRSGDK